MEPSKSFESPEVKLHFLDYWRIIRIRKTVILAVFLLVAITTTLVTYILPPTYASTVRISVEKDASDISGLDGQKVTMSYDPFWVQGQSERIQSKLILHQVITNLDLTRKWAEKYKESELRLDIAFSLLKRQTRVDLSRNTTHLEISAFSDDPGEAALIANTIAEVYRESRLNKWREMSSRGLYQLEEEYATNTMTLTNLQAKLDALKDQQSLHPYA
jgi:polysaccharide biosynthesis transport protein